MDQRELDALNPELYRQAREAIMGDDPPDAPPADAGGLDETPAVPDNEDPANGGVEHAPTPPESDTPAAPGPEQAAVSPPSKFVFAGREYDSQEAAERSQRELQAFATRQSQRAAELERSQREKEDTQPYLAPLDQLSEEEYRRQEQEAQRFGLDVQTYRGLRQIQAAERADKARVQADQDEHYLSGVVESHIGQHPLLGQYREQVGQALQQDPGIFMLPQGLPLAEQERIVRRRIDQVFSDVAKEQTQQSQLARDEALKKAAITEYEQKQALARQAATTEAGSSKAVAPSSKPAAPGDAGDELIDLFKKRRAKLDLKG